MEKASLIRVLNVVPNMRAAGIETFIMNVYRNIDREKVQFDFLVHSKKKCFYDDEIEKLGGKIYRFSFKDDKNFIKYINDLNTFFEEHNEYNIVHGHMQSMMPLYLKIAKKHGVPIRIAHAHNSSYEKTVKGFILHIFSRFSKKYSSYNYACSKLAGEYLFGKKQFEVIYNGINIDKFKYSDDVRKKKRKELKIDDDKHVIINIGRFELQKNQSFLVDVINEYYKEDKELKVFLVGEGKLEKNIKKKVTDLNLSNTIVFLGIRNDVNELLQACDLFVLPSLYEGLPVVGVEAQCTGIKCAFSDKITKEVQMNDFSEFIELKEKSWISFLNNIEWNYERKQTEDFSKFDITKIAKNLEERYRTYEKKYEN